MISARKVSLICSGELSRELKHSLVRQCGTADDQQLAILLVGPSNESGYEDPRL